MSKATILIVEDEEIVAMDLANKLRRLHYEIGATTATGEEAVTLARERHPDLVLMDIRLAGSMDGVTAAEIIRRECDLPIVYLTAHSDRPTLQRAKVTEPYGYILKPFSERELEAYIEIALYKHKTEQELRAQREWLAVTLKSIGDAVITTDRSGKVTSLNPVAEEMTGWKIAEAVGRPLEEVFNIINEVTRNPWPNPVEKVLREGKVIALANHTALIARHGMERAIEDSAAPIKDAQGGILGVVMVFHDVTEKRRAQEALRASEARLTQAVRVAGLGTFEHDHKPDVIEFSSLMRELMGFGQTEEIRIPAIVRKVAPDDREAFSRAIQQAHNPAGDGQFQIEYRVPRLEGGLRWVSARSQTFFEGEGSQRRPVRTIGAALDVTERREAQAGLERLVNERTAKLQELVGDLEHFSHTITHDMRAPLRALQGFASMMTEACAECRVQEPKEFLRRISVSGARMDALITDALSYSRAVRQELPLTLVDVGALLRGMLDSYPELQPSKATIAIEGEIPLVVGNEAGLTQCFSNLLGNAVKFVKPGQRPEVRIRAEPREGWVRIWVEDNGIGIPALMVPRVFDMFARGHTKYEGTGIGLALVRKVTERMGGNVGVESEDGKGSRFWLDLRPGDPRVRR
jgi:PAS domain S-box-containing protein